MASFSEHWWAEGAGVTRNVWKVTISPFLHCALKKISYFSNAGVLQTVSLGENQVSLGKSRTPAMQVRGGHGDRIVPAPCLKGTVTGDLRSRSWSHSQTPDLVLENTDVNKMMPLHCWEIHSVVVDRDFFFFCNCIISFPVVKTVFQCRGWWILSLVGS